MNDLVIYVIILILIWLPWLLSRRKREVVTVEEFEVEYVKVMEVEEDQPEPKEVDLEDWR